MTAKLQFIASWNDFLLPLVLILSQPELQTLAVGVYSFQGKNLTDYAQMSAASTISLLPVIAVFLSSSATSSRDSPEPSSNDHDPDRTKPRSIKPQ